MTPRSHRYFTALSCAFAGIWATSTAAGAVTEPDGTEVPCKEKDSRDYISDYYRPDTLGLQSMLNLWEGVTKDADGNARPNIDAYVDASAVSVVFSPLCGLNSTLILRGGSCLADFGWYCTDDPVGQEQIHPLIAAADLINYHDNVLLTLPEKPPPPPDTWKGYQNSERSFVPTIQAGYLKPVQSTTQLGDVRNSTQYKNCKSGRIGFAFKGNPSSICPMSKFSEPARNQPSQFGGQPWISVVAYPSKKNVGVYYLAFEDMPTSVASFTPSLGSLKSDYPQMTTGTSGWEKWQNDGDMNDLVYRVEGILCQGGGQACTPTKADGTLWQGACSLGVTACSSDPKSPGPCLQRIQPQKETCNGWDDDCNGIADDGAGLCQDGYVCDNGKCISSCVSSTSPCADSSTVCQRSGSLMGFCVEVACLNAECPVGQRCVTGKCVGGCEDRTCPKGTECLAGGCIDLCAGVTCPSNFVCERGACIPDCKCLPCSDSDRPVCSSDGHCIEKLCSGITCEPFKTCVAGSCVDPCASEPCGVGAQCTATADGKPSCPPIDKVGSGGANSAAMMGPAVAGNVHAVHLLNGGTAASVPAAGLAGGGNAKVGTSHSQPPHDGCACRMSGRPPNGGGFLPALASLSAAALSLRRRRARRPSSRQR